VAPAPGPVYSPLQGGGGGGDMHHERHPDSSSWGPTVQLGNDAWSWAGYSN